MCSDVCNILLPPCINSYGSPGEKMSTSGDISSNVYYNDILVVKYLHSMHEKLYIRKTVKLLKAHLKNPAMHVKAQDKI